MPGSDGGRLEAIYRRARGSKGCVIGLLLFCACWTAANVLTGFDHGWGGYNTILSTEASLGLSLLLMWMEKQDQITRTMLEVMQRQLERQLGLTEALHASLVGSGTRGGRAGTGSGVGPEDRAERKEMG